MSAAAWYMFRRGPAGTSCGAVAIAAAQFERDSEHVILDALHCTTGAPCWRGDRFDSESGRMRQTAPWQRFHGWSAPE